MTLAILTLLRMSEGGLGGELRHDNNSNRRGGDLFDRLLMQMELQDEHFISCSGE
jgi:hypothetical protein